MSWFSKWKKFIAEVRTELKRTTWPNRMEVRNTTIVVIVTAVIFSAFLWVVDVMLSTIIARIFSAFSA